MKIKKGVQNFTTGSPNRHYSNTFDYHHPTNQFSRRQTFTSSSSPQSVIKYLDMSDGTFAKRNAIRNSDGTYRTKEEESLTLEELQSINQENILMRGIVRLLDRNPLQREELLYLACLKLGVHREIISSKLPYLITEGVIGENMDDKLTSNRSDFNPNAWKRIIPRYHARDAPKDDFAQEKEPSF